MASTGKSKKQKSKPQTMSLQSFLAKDNENIQAGFSVVTAKRPGMDWVAEAERDGQDEDDHQEMTYSSRDHQQYILPSAPMGPNVDMDKIPTSAPYTAFIGGLSYDTEQEDIREFFKKLKVLSVRIPRSASGETERFRGFGYVEFEDRDSLIDALAMNESFFKSGRVKIDIAENQNDPSRRRGDKSDRSDRDRSDPNRAEQMVGNWRSAPRDEPARPERSFRDDPDPPRERFGGDRSDRSDRYGGDRSDRGDRYGERSDRGDRYGDRSDRGDRYGDRSDRSDRYGSRGFDRGQNDRDSGGGGYRESRDRGYGNFSRGGSDRSFPSDRQRDDAPDRGYDRGSRGGGRREYGSGFERRGDDRRDFGSSRNASSYDRPERSDTHSSNADNELDAEREAPRERPKLVIKPRTKPLEEAGAPVAMSAIFGGAKPVDTAARERQIELRMEKEREMASSRTLGESRGRDTERDSHKEETRKDYSHEYSEEPQRRPSTGSQPGSRHSSTSVPPPSSVRSSDGGASGQSETDEEKEKPAAVVAKPPSPRREDSKAVPAPPPKENAWARRSTTQPQPPSAGERSKSSETEKENRHSNAPYTQQRSSSVSSTGSDDKPRYLNTLDGRPPASKTDDPGYGRKEEDNVFRGHGESRGGSRGAGRGGSRGAGRGYGERRGGQDGYSRNHSENSYSGRYDDRQHDNERPKEMPKFVEPEIPSYASSNKFTQLTAEEYDD